MILDILEKNAEAYRKFNRPNILFEFVLKAGRKFENFDEFPFEMMEPNQCFHNATMVNFLNPFGTDSEIYYIEGFMVRENIGLPIHHAWVEVDGVAYDPTIKDFASCEYYGVTYSPETTFEQVQKNGFYGLFIPNGLEVNVALMREAQPDLVNMIMELHDSPRTMNIF